MQRTGWTNALVSIPGTEGQLPPPQKKSVAQVDTNMDVPSEVSTYYVHLCMQFNDIIL